MRFRFRGIPCRHAFINVCCKISPEIFRKAEFYDNNGKDRHSRIHVLYLACKSNKSLFPWREIVMSSFFLETLTAFAAWRLTPGLTDKSYINFQDVTSTLKNMRTALFARQGMGAVFRFVSDHRWGPLGESDIHSNTIRPTIDRSF